MTETLRLTISAALLGFIGLCLVLDNVRWFSRQTLRERLGPHLIASSDAHERSTIGRHFIPDLSPYIERVVGLLGIKTSLELRLSRAHDSRTSAQFRGSQVVRVVVAFVCAATLSAALRPSPVVIGLMLIGAPLLTLLAIEQQITTRAERNRKVIFDELATFAEQFAMLLDAGYSVGAAINRIGARGAGLIGRDLSKVRERVQLGLSAEDAVSEWASAYQIPELDRLATLLHTGGEGGDLGHLVSEEARNIRRAAHRRQIELIEKNSQQVWIPVTVATLIPGVILLIIPFLAALDIFVAH